VGRRDRGQALGEIAGRVEHTVGNVEAWRTCGDAIGDRAEQLVLGQRTVIRDVVGLPGRAVVIQDEQQAADHVGDVDERHVVIAPADDDSASRAQPVCHPAEVQVITRTEDLIRPDDHRGQMVLGDHPLHG
jgi:hypothetical protein